MKMIHSIYSKVLYHAYADFFSLNLVGMTLWRPFKNLYGNYEKTKQYFLFQVKMCKKAEWFAFINEALYYSEVS